MCVLIHEISFELQVETILMLMIFPVMLNYLSCHFVFQLSWDLKLEYFLPFTYMIMRREDVQCKCEELP